MATGEGATHVVISGPDDGPPVLLVHGATVPHWQFDGVLPILHAAGFRTLSLDLLGHGRSPRPTGLYSLDRLAMQVEDAALDAGWRAPLAVVGHSMGGAIAAHVAAREVLAVERVVLTAPLLDFGAVSRVLPLLRTPVLGELFMGLYGTGALVRRRHRRFAAIGRPDLAGRFDKQLDVPGFARGLLALARGDAFGPHHARYAALGEADQQVLLLWGDGDDVIPADHVALIRDLLRGHRYEQLTGLEHNFLLAQPELLGGHICDFLAAAAP